MEKSILLGEGVLSWCLWRGDSGNEWGGGQSESIFRNAGWSHREIAPNVSTSLTGSQAGMALQRAWVNSFPFVAWARFRNKMKTFTKEFFQNSFSFFISEGWIKWRVFTKLFFFQLFLIFITRFEISLNKMKTFHKRARRISPARFARRVGNVKKCKGL